MTYELALASTQFSHARVRNWCGQSIVYIYHRAPWSPSGVMLACGVPESPEVDAAFKRHNRTSPLSPTEPR